MNTQTTNKHIRSFEGTVVKTAMQKTISVLVERRITDKKYHKKYASSKIFLVHDENGIAKVGNVVRVIACRPLSKNKCWRIAAIIK